MHRIKGNEQILDLNQRLAEKRKIKKIAKKVLSNIYNNRKIAYLLLFSQSILWHIFTFITIIITQIEQQDDISRYLS